MASFRKLAILAVLLAGLGTFFSCGSSEKYLTADGKSAGLAITSNATPVVITTPYSYYKTVPDGLEGVTSQLVTVAADWMRFNFHFANNGAKEVTIVSMAIEIDIGGTSSSSDGKSYYTCTVSPETSVTGVSYLLDLAPGAADDVKGYCDGITFPTTTTNFATSARLKVSGWIGSKTTPTARLGVDTFSFKTQ